MAKVDGIELNPPAKDEYEITLLGPGYGESVAVHVGGGQWVIVDSCIDRVAQEPAALSYLKRIGVSPSAVVLVIASHWHDDHIRGIARVVEECAHATFACSIALQSKEFLHLVSSDGLSQTALTSGVSEFKAILDILHERRPRVPKFALADMVLWESKTAGQNSQILALTPSSAAVVSALQLIAKMVPEVTGKRHRIPDLKPNDTSVAVVASSGAESSLLGGDLETTSAPDTGWNGVFTNSVTPVVSGVYKVAHHGSDTGHHDRIYIDLLVKEAICVLTPFRRGRVSLPLDTDVHRISAASSGPLYVTAVGGQQPPRDSAVTRTLREMNARIETIDPVMGTVQVRRAQDAAAWRVRLSDKARKLA